MLALAHLFLPTRHGRTSRVTGERGVRIDVRHLELDGWAQRTLELEAADSREERHLPSRRQEFSAWLSLHRELDRRGGAVREEPGGVPFTPTQP